MDVGKAVQPLHMGLELPLSLLVALSRIENPVAVDVELLIADFGRERHRIERRALQEIVEGGRGRCGRAKVGGAGVVEDHLRLARHLRKHGEGERLFGRFGGPLGQIRNAGEDSVEASQIAPPFRYGLDPEGVAKSLDRKYSVLKGLGDFSPFAFKGLLRGGGPLGVSHPGRPLILAEADPKGPFSLKRAKAVPGDDQLIERGGRLLLPNPLGRTRRG